MPVEFNEYGEIIRRNRTANTPYPRLPDGGNGGGGFNFWWLFIPIMIIVLINFIYQSEDRNSSNQISPEISIPTIVVNRTGYISASEYANIRNGPSINNGIIAKKNRGEPIYIIERDIATGWYKVKYSNGNTGYVSEKLVSFNYVSPNKLVENQADRVVADNTVVNNDKRINSNNTAEDNNKRLNYPDGGKYVGSVINNKKDGIGTYYFANGNKYVGSFKNDLKNGKGVLFFTDKSSCEGIWKNDLRDGNFIYYDNYGKSEIQVFNNGTRVR